jgi:hypothetical protein
MNGYSLKVISGIGSTVYATSINKNHIEIKTSDLGANGLYIIQLINPQNEVTENRKIVIK